MTYNIKHYETIKGSSTLMKGLYESLLISIKNGADIQDIEQFLDYSILHTNRLKEFLNEKGE
jgi:hypothetical protein